LYKFFKFCTLLLLLCLPFKSWALDTYEIGCESANVAWDLGNNTPEMQWHELRTVWIDGLAFQYSNEFAVMMPKQTALVPRPRSGHSEIEIRGCRFTDGVPECSNWVNSTVIGLPNPWEVYWKPLPPGNIIIE
jgi:hypothetical protein